MIEANPVLSYKDVLFAGQYVLMLFYDIQKDEGGNEYFDDFFVRDLQGAEVDYLELSDKEIEWLKQQV